MVVVMDMVVMVVVVVVMVVMVCQTRQGPTSSIDAAF
jgi:uncharacterized membrane protein